MSCCSSGAQSAALEVLCHLEPCPAAEHGHARDSNSRSRVAHAARPDDIFARSHGTYATFGRRVIMREILHGGGPPFRRSAAQVRRSH
jgi:hypothetical protein